MGATLLCLSFAGLLTAPLPAALPSGFALTVPAICLTSQVAPSPLLRAGLSAVSLVSAHALAGTGLALTAGEAGEQKAPAGNPVSPSTMRIVATILGLPVSE